LPCFFLQFTLLFSTIWQSTAVDRRPSRPRDAPDGLRPVQRLDGRRVFYVVPSEAQDGRTGLWRTLWQWDKQRITQFVWMCIRPGHHPELWKVGKKKREGKSRFKIRDFLADGRCSQAVLGFLSATDVRRLVPAGEDAGSKVSEWGLRERREREEEKRVETEELGARGEEPFSFRRPLSWRLLGNGKGGLRFLSFIPWFLITTSFVLYLVRIPFLCDFIGAHHIFLGQAGQRGACNVPPRGQRAGKLD